MLQPQTDDFDSKITAEEFYFDADGLCRAGEDPTEEIYAHRLSVTGAQLVEVADEFSDTGTTKIWKGGVATITITHRGENPIALHLTSRMERALNVTDDLQTLLRPWYRDAKKIGKAFAAKKPAAAQLTAEGEKAVAALSTKLQQRDRRMGILSKLSQVQF